MKQFGGEVLFLDKNNITTEEIISSKYFEDNSKTALKAHLFESLTLEGFNPITDVAGKKVIVARENFGEGEVSDCLIQSLQVNEINTVIAVSFNQAFSDKLNAEGILTIVLNKKSIDDMFHTFATKDAESKIVINEDETAKVKLIAGSLSVSYQWKLTEEQKKLLK